MTEDFSLIKVAAGKVVALADAKIEAFNKQECYYRAEAIAQAKAEREAWRRWFFWLKPLTDAEAERWSYDAWCLPMRLLCGVVERRRYVERLRALAQGADDGWVYLSHGDYRRLTEARL